MKLKRLNLSLRAISLGLSYGAVAALGQAAISSTAFAEEVEELEKIKVTGSRILRTDMEGSQQVHVLSREDIEKTGAVNIADVLRATTGNSFGSFSETSGSTAQSQATVDLRGLGDERTLVLLNGVRVPASPSYSGAAANLNSLPIALIERVEIMADGASAIYGSDAIGGVINIILKDDFEGGLIAYGQGLPSQEGGDEESYNFALGTSGERGNMLFSYEHDEKDIIYRRDRFYTSSANLDTEYFVNTRNISTYGRNLRDPRTGTYTPLAGSLDENGNCRDGFLGPYTENPNTPDSQICAYDYTGVAAQTSSLERDTAMFNGRMDINENIDFYTQFIFNQVESFGRFAPVAGRFTVNPTTVGGQRFFDENGLDYDADGNGTVDASDTYRVRYRFDGLGPRDNNVTDQQWDIVVGLDGTWEESPVGDISWDIKYHYNQADNNSIGTGYALRSLALGLIDDGDYANGEFDPDALQSISHETARHDEMVFDQWLAGFSFDYGELAGGDISWAFGAEHTSFDYNSAVDAQSAAGNVMGSSGGNQGGQRKQMAFYAETLLPVTEELEVQGAIRYDKYSDFGDVTTGRLFARYQPMDTVTLRSSFGLGFRAPTLSDLYAADSFSADDATDLVRCRANNIADAACPEEQFFVTRTSNEELDAEKSTSFTFGVVVNVTDTLDVGLEYYNITIEDVIEMQTVDASIRQELNSGSSPNITRTSSGIIDEAIAPMENLGELETDGIDVTLNWELNGIADRQVSRYQRDSADALAAAETGLAMAKRMIQDMTAPMEDADSDGQPDFTHTDTLSWGGEYRFIAEAGEIHDIDISAYRSDGYTIVCEGRARGAVRRLRVELAHDTFLKYARFVEASGTGYSCQAVLTGEIYLGGSLNVPSCASGQEVTFLEYVAVTGTINNPDAGIFMRGYVTDATAIDLGNSVDFAEMEAKAKGTASESDCDDVGSIGCFQYSAGGWDPLGLASTGNVLDLTLLDFHDTTTSPGDTLVRYNGALVTNTQSGQPLRSGDFNGLIYFHGDAHVKGTLAGVSGRSLTIFASDDVFADDSIICGHTGFDPITRDADGSGDPVNLGLVARDYFYLGDCPRIVQIDAALMAVDNNWRAYNTSTSAHPAVTVGPLDLDLDGLTGETPVNHDPDTGLGWDEQNITSNHWVLNINGPIITHNGGSASPWNSSSVLAGAAGPTRRYNYDLDITEFPPPCYPVPLNLWVDVSWTESFDSESALEDLLP